MYFVHTCVLEELYFDILSNFYLLIMHFPCRPLDGQDGWLLLRRQNQVHSQLIKVVFLHRCNVYY